MVASARTTAPFASTTCADTSRSHAMPYLRDSGPKPPPWMYPPAHTVGQLPVTTARPRGDSAPTASTPCVPGPNATVDAPTVSDFRRDVSSTRPVVVDQPAALWPPDRTATCRSLYCANASTVRTSPTVSQYATPCGLIVSK